MIAESLANAYRSERLVYRAVENNEEDKSFVHTEINSDPVLVALASKRVVQPRDQRLAQKLVEMMQASVMGVLICLPAGGDDGSAATSNGDKKTAKSTPIGILVVEPGVIDAETARHRLVTLAISLAAPFRNKGYGTEAINWVLDWSFRCGGFHRVSIFAWSHNERAVHLYKRLGFVEEGRIRESVWLDRKWYDEVHLGILESEWEALRGAREG